MDFTKLIQQSAEYGYNSLASGLGVAGAGVGYITKSIGSLQLFGSTVTDSADKKLDERHYFLVPDPRSEDGYSLVVTRLLPEGVPPVNDLEKRRFLHLPNSESAAMLRTLLVRRAQIDELAKPAEGKSMSDRARELADYIDAVDDKVFGGVLLIGGLVAIFNPLAGAAIAAKSLLPSLGILASKYGLKIAEESLSHANLKSKVRQAEKEVLSQFHGSETEQHVNEVLCVLERATRTTEEEFDPMLELHNLLQTEMPDDQKSRIQLASAAVLNVFDSTLRSPNTASKLGLGAEDLRFLKLLQSLQQ